jgi:hemerythrin-like domain-containing protein
MKEHRLIEKMLGVIDKELRSIKEFKKVNPLSVDEMVDFIRVYADRTHHGKEEDILFEELKNRNLDEANQSLMNELVEEHEKARAATKAIIEANARYIDGDESSMTELVDNMSFLLELYPQHIEKEDDKFFPDTESYFSDEELDAMLEEFWDFDKEMIHEKYTKVYESLSKEYE